MPFRARSIKTEHGGSILRQAASSSSSDGFHHSRDQISPPPFFQALQINSKQENTTTADSFAACLPFIFSQIFTHYSWYSCPVRSILKFPNKMPVTHAVPSALSSATWVDLVIHPHRSSTPARRKSMWTTSSMSTCPWRKISVARTYFSVERYSPFFQLHRTASRPT